MTRVPAHDPHEHLVPTKMFPTHALDPAYQWQLIVCTKGHRMAIPRGTELLRCIKARCRGKLHSAERKSRASK